MYKDEIEEDGSRRASMISKDATRVTEKEVDWSRETSDDWRDFTVSATSRRGLFGLLMCVARWHDSFPHGRAETTSPTRT